MSLVRAGVLTAFFWTPLFSSTTISLAQEETPCALIAPIQAAIQTRIMDSTASGSLTCQGEIICGIHLLPSIYEKRQYQPLWNNGLHPTAEAIGFVEAIERASEDGLEPADYYLAAIRKLLAAIRDKQMAGERVPASWWADLDFILTDAFLLYGSHLSTGRVNPETLHNDWKVKPDAVNLEVLLDRITTPESDVNAIIDSLRPPYPEYRSLQKALFQLRNLAATQGGWPVVPDKQTLRPGDRNAVVRILRQRLIISGDMPTISPEAQADLFDPALAKAVKHFQKKNGLGVDGVVGPKTFYMLNVPVEDRIRQVVVNLERWRWRPRSLGRRYVMVNTADFNLKAVENNTVALDMRVVVGRPARRSPVFSAEISYLVINPYWNLPTKIAGEDILPHLKRGNFAYLHKRKIRVFQGWENDSPEVNIETVDWSVYRSGRIPFRLRQDPGPTNSLGRIKFMFPNPFAVYLHDTPNQSQFGRAKRDFSSGCIRVEFPMKLADFVLAETPEWPPEKLAAAMKSGKTQTIRLRHPVPVHLLYMTAWIDDAGVLQFRDDIYDRDSVLQKTLTQHRPKVVPPFPSPRTDASASP
ncbi:L,D-transpeptidase family protein [Desulfosarcina sp. OttesenSCG-928-G10]|nr:L,D-transpeptidase family protein [Desulfosarcina sp. OttesenSCG-928-G10]